MTPATPKTKATRDVGRTRDAAAARAGTPGVLSLVSADEDVLGSTATVRLSPGRRVPGTRYRIVRWLGEGGMGVIYEAEHMDVQRKVALKVLREDAIGNPGAASELRAEARTASQIGSPYIVEVFDLGTLPDGRMFMALELVQGRDLFEDVAAGPMLPTRLIPVLRQICKGLAAAHAAGIIHRDIKPENVLLGRKDGRGDAVKLVDFGVARVMNTARVETHAVGTPVYMAPECWTGENIDHRADLYALGITAYELLAGVPPCDGTAQEVMLFHLEGDPPPIGRLRKGSSVSSEIEAIIAKCIAKRREDRFADAADLEAALCEAQVALGIETPWDDLPLPDVAEERRDRLLRTMPSPDVVNVPAARHRWWIAAAMGAALTLAGVATYGALADDPPSAQEVSAITALTNEAHEAAARAYYVYPPEHEPDDTAYRKVLELEALGGAAQEPGREAAATLRGVFATTLVRLGDRYWAREGGRIFAVDYYAQALLFDAAAPRANERSPLTVVELAELRRKARDLDFTADERRAVAPLVILAAEDESAALSSLEAYFAEDHSSSVIRDASVERLLRGSGRKAKPKPRRSDRDVPASASERAPPAQEESRSNETPPPQPTGEPEARESVSEPPAPSAASQSSSAAAAALVKEARAAARAGNKSRAEALYHQALAKNGRSGAALIGLSNVYFERASYFRAMEYATKAVKRSPKTASYRISLGDAYFKLMRYNDARKQYAWAKRLGHPAAGRRLDKVDAKLGG